MDWRAPCSTAALAMAGARPRQRIGPVCAPCGRAGAWYWRTPRLTRRSPALPGNRRGSISSVVTAVDARRFYDYRPWLASGALVFGVFRTCGARNAARRAPTLPYNPAHATRGLRPRRRRRPFFLQLVSEPRGARPGERNPKLLEGGAAEERKDAMPMSRDAVSATTAERFAS